MATDASIAQNVDRALWNNGLLRSTDYREIEIKVTDGIVALSGHVINSTNQRQAEAAARAVPGVRSVISHLVPDDKIVREVAMVLGKIEHVYGVKFFTGARNGVVVLTGDVADPALRSQAEKFAANLPEVRGVINAVRAPGVDLNAEDQRFLQPAVGQQLYFRDNLTGKVDRVIINPHNRRVAAMVVRARFSTSPQNPSASTYGADQLVERLVVIPMHAVRYLTSGAGFLDIDSTEAAGGKDFDLSGFTAPGDDWTPPYPYRRDHILFPAAAVEEMKQTERELAAKPAPSPWIQQVIPGGVPV